MPSHRAVRLLPHLLACALVLGCAGPLPGVAVAVDPTVLDSNSRAAARVSADDASGGEGLVLTYQWLKNGNRIEGATAAYLDLAVDGSGDRGDAIAVEVVAQRGRARAAPTRSAAVTVGPVVTLEVRETTAYYPVEGVDSASLVASIRRNAPREGNSVAFGQVRFTSEPLEFRAVRIEGGCAIEHVVLRNDVLVTLPDTVRAALAPGLRAKFERFRDAVAAHEQRHVTIRRQHLDLLVATLKAAGPAPTCAALNEQVDRAITSALAIESAEQQRFHQEDDARLRSACAALDEQIAALSATLETVRSQPARYNALIPAYNALVDDYNWCVKS